MNLVLNIIIAAVALLIGIIIGYRELYKRKYLNLEKKKEKAENLVLEAEKIAKKSKEEALRKKQETEASVEKNIEIAQKLIDQMEKSVNNKETALKKQEEKLNETKLKIASAEEAITALEAQIQILERKQKTLLAEKSGKKEEDLKKEVVNRYKAELEQDYDHRLANVVEEAKEKAPRLAQKLIINAIQRLCSPTSVEQRAVHVIVPKDIIKGKIVGKDAKNILKFEELLDVDVVFNDLPNTISISAFNLVNRRIAQKALELLTKTNREIDEKIIKEAIDRSKQEMDTELFEIGKKAVDMLGFKNLTPELVRTIGRLQFRTSYSQNIMLHSLEVCYLATMLGSELGADVRVCKVAGFLHDLGKAIDQNPDIQGSHDFLTKELMEKYGFGKEEIHAAWTHHESEKPETVEALLIQAADALSASRPGARQESIEKYIERLQALEAAASSFEGVKKAFAISAGREVRVIVDPMIINDKQTQALADKIAAKVESELSYPGKIKINAIRKTKTIEIAK